MRKIFTLGSVFIASCVLLLSCTKKKTEQASTEIFTNCKLPIADGGGGAAIGGFPRYPDRLPSTGTVQANVILVDFPDAVATKTPAEAYAMISGASATFSEMSYGRMQYALTPTLQWFRMSKASDQYDFGTFQGHKDYIQEAVGLADSTVDFSNTDSLVVISNPDASGTGNFGPAWVPSAGSGLTVDGNEILNAVTSAFDLNTWGSIWLNHEVTHNLGLVDLYASQPLNPSNPYDLLRFTGMFSYMGYNSSSSNSPGLTAWERWVLGWLDDDQVQCSNPKVDGEINTLITPLGATGGKKAVIIPIGATKVIVVESRRAQGIDSNLVKAGALVYTVDSSTPRGLGPIQVYPISSSDPLYLQAPRASNEAVSVGGYRIQVSSSSADGDTIRITAE